ncbi:hypothetical protein [Chryseobacterium sp. JUb7]|uniref:hypothetical protein n=1 Tax=Chryseobacterium sp. JUb7 TaxID=2940599 RepID=UPI00216A782F|nr:hypothetical protein [Chryseobacterium sp. JUb7]MCS3531889.1 hypothetical protein [Chryseobacterium sp. JUb7]
MKKKIFTTLCFVLAVSYASAQKAPVKDKAVEKETAPKDDSKFLTGKKVTFTDNEFKKQIVAKYDLNRDGDIDQSEADKVSTIIIGNNNLKIRSAEDINLFRNVQSVVLDGSIILDIDLKNLDYLNLFSCVGCNLRTFKSENLKSLTDLYLNNNKDLQTIDVSALNKLMVLDIKDTQIKKLDVSQNPDLMTLNVSTNTLTEENIKRGKKAVSTAISSPSTSSSAPQRPPGN